jgi:hypothetical protein
MDGDPNDPNILAPQVDDDEDDSRRNSFLSALMAAGGGQQAGPAAASPTAAAGGPPVAVASQDPDSQLGGATPQEPPSQPTPPVGGTNNPSSATPVADSGLSLRDAAPTLLKPGEKQEFDPANPGPDAEIGASNRPGPFGGSFTGAPVQPVGPSQRETDLKSQISGLTANPSLKSRLLRIAPQIVGIALAGKFGHTEGAAGAAQGTVAGLRYGDYQREQQLGALRSELEAELGREQQTKERQLEIEGNAPLRNAQADYYRQRGDELSQIPSLRQSIAELQNKTREDQEDATLAGKGLSRDPITHQIVNRPQGAGSVANDRDSAQLAEHGLERDGQGNIVARTGGAPAGYRPDRAPNDPARAGAGGAAAAKTAVSIKRQYDTDLQKLEQNFTKQYRTPAKGSLGEPGKTQWETMSPEEQQDALDELRDAKQNAQNEFESRAEAAGQTVPHYEYPRMTSAAHANARQPGGGAPAGLPPGATVREYNQQDGSIR